MKAVIQTGDFKAEFNSDLDGYVVTFKSGNVAHTQFTIESDRLHADYGERYLESYPEYDDELTEEEELQLYAFIKERNQNLMKPRCNITQTEITDESQISDRLPITRLGGSTDPRGEEMGLAFFQVDFKVDVTNDIGETQSFDFTYQQRDRSGDNMTAFSGDEMEPYFENGNDEEDLAEFLGSHDQALEVLSELESKADEIAEEALEGFIEQYGEQYLSKLREEEEGHRDMFSVGHHNDDMSPY